MSEEDSTVNREVHPRISRIPANWICAFCFLLLLFFGALFWARGRDPFERRWFTIKTPGSGKAECLLISPKSPPSSDYGAARWPLPVVLYLHGSGGSVLTSGNELRQIAELGLAVVAMEYEGKVESR